MCSGKLRDQGRTNQQDHAALIIHAIHPGHDNAIGPVDQIVFVINPRADGFDRRITTQVARNIFPLYIGAKAATAQQLIPLENLITPKIRQPIVVLKTKNSPIKQEEFIPS